MFSIKFSKLIKPIDLKPGSIIRSNNKYWLIKYVENRNGYTTIQVLEYDSDNLRAIDGEYDAIDLSYGEHIDTYMICRKI